MDVKERRPYCSLTKNRRERERRCANSSADSAECRVPTQKSYSSSETLKAFDHDSSRLLYGNRVKDLVHREADEFTRQGRSWLQQNEARSAPANLQVSLCSLRGDMIISQIDVLSSDLDFEILDGPRVSHIKSRKPPVDTWTQMQVWTHVKNHPTPHIPYVRL